MEMPINIESGTFPWSMINILFSPEIVFYQLFTQRKIIGEKDI